MKVGDKVTWESQGRGSDRIKRGVVVAIVPAHTPRHEILQRIKAHENYDDKGIFVTASPRDHDSYLIAVPGGRHGKDQLFHPPVSVLRDGGKG